MVNHDILSPDTSLHFLGSGVMSYVRYSCAIWGQTRWFKRKGSEAGGTEEPAAVNSEATATTGEQEAGSSRASGVPESSTRLKLGAGEYQAVKAVDALFPPVLKDIIDAEHTLAVNQAVMKELGWIGVEGEIVVSQLRMFNYILRMPPTRLPHQLLLYHLRQMQFDEQGQAIASAAYGRPHQSRLCTQRQLQNRIFTNLENC